MDEIIKFLEMQGGQGDSLGPWEVLFSMLLCLACVTFVSNVYRFTHKSAGYSQAFFQTLVLLGLVTTLVMIVIGSNIARAFSLVGALSIIRFRNAVKETRDVGYIYLVMAIAMACGTRFYVVAVVAVLMICSALLVMYFVNIGSSPSNPERLLRAQFPPGTDPEAALQPVLSELFQSFAIVALETVRQGLYLEVLLSVRPKPGVSGSRVIDAISGVNDNLKVTYHSNAETDNL